MLTASAANAKTAAIAQAFAAIGITGDTAMPRSKKNTEPAAWAYHVACQAFRAADAARKKAHAECVRLGILPDHAKAPFPVGTEALVYAGDVVEIAVSVTTASERTDLAQLGVLLVKAGLPLPKVEKAFRAATSTNAAPHAFKTSLRTS
jgi:hypothetical protein